MNTDKLNFLNSKIDELNFEIDQWIVRRDSFNKLISVANYNIEVINLISDVNDDIQNLKNKELEKINDDITFFNSKLLEFNNNIDYLTRKKNTCLTLKYSVISDVLYSA